jgi:tRNA nucleotidyltransferase (CCA-adding enzyme)
MDVITTHLNADFDALASMLAASRMYPDAIAVFPGAQEKSVRDFIASSDLPFDCKKLKDINLKDITRLILVDVKNPDRIGKFSEIIGNKGLTIHIYDHHPFSEEDIRGQKEVIEPVGATTTIFTDMLQKNRRKISPAEATILMLGIYEETGSLIFSSTTVRDISAAAFLLKKGANLNVVSSFITRELGAEEIALLNDLLNSSKDYVIHDVRVKIAKAYRETYIGEIALIAHKMRDMEDVDALFLLVMLEERVQIIARSHSPEVDVSEILHDFGGGGHAQASSAVVRDMSVEETETKLLAALKRKIRPSKTAQDIMTSPVKSIDAGKTISAAEKALTKYEVNVLPVLKQKTYYGLISREVVEKALFHGFGKSRVTEFCTTGAPSVKPTTPLNHIEAQMVEQNQRFMPVIKDSRVVGAITRTDILRSIYESLLKKNRIKSHEQITDKPSTGKNLTATMKARFPKEVFELLEYAGVIARELGYTAYIVGGSVRDLLQGEANLDIDIVIEGNGIKFARYLGKKIQAKVKSHKRFGTAVIITDFLKFDVATARTEFYESPAALPQVEMSSIKKDLYRRDFTINTLAVKLNPENFGQLIDFFGAQRDIKDKTIRILHNLSFIEDPTRAFRAIRFSERFGFRISKHTLNLIKTSVRINLFAKLSGTRLYDELNLLFLETEPLRSIQRMAELDLLKCIHPGLVITKTLMETFESIQETFSWFKLLYIDEELNKPHLFLMALIETLAPDERTVTLQRLAVPPKAQREMLKGIEQAKIVLSKLTKVSHRKIYHLLLPLELQTVLFAMAKAEKEEQKKNISIYLTKLRHIRPSLTGKDLKAMGYAPGPLYKKIMHAVLDGRLDGKVQSHEEEVDFVRNLFSV